MKPICALLSAALLLAPSARAETYKWDSMAMGSGGYVTGVIPSKSERGMFYARTDVGGAYRWDKHNERWVPLLDWLSEANLGYMGVESIAVDPKNAANIYLMTGTPYFSFGKSAILRSTDYGRSFDIVDVTSHFQVHGNGWGRGNGEKLQIDPGDSRVLYAGSRGNGLFRSTDAGATWTRLESLPVTSTANGNGISFVLLDPTSVDGGPAQRIFVGVSRLDSAGPNLYFSYDGGETFEPVEGGPAGLMPQRAVMSPDGQLYLTYANGAGPGKTGDGEPMDRGQIWEYDAAGGNWTDITPASMIGSYGGFGGISIDPADPRHLVASTINTWKPQAGQWGDRIFTTRDAGRTWVDVIERGFAKDPKGKSYINNYSMHWTADVEFDPFDTKSAWVTSGNGVFRTTNIDAPTTTWAFETAGMEETVNFSVLSLPNGQLITATGDVGGFLLNDPAQYGQHVTPDMSIVTDVAGSGDGSVLARVGDRIFYSTNSGASWTQSAVIMGSWGDLALSTDGQVLLHSPEHGTTTYRSTDFGTNWTIVSGLNVLNAHPVADPVNPLKFYAYDNVNGRMLVSHDRGVSFAPQGTLPAGGARKIVATPGIEGDLWACAGGGLLHTADGGATFSKIAAVADCSAVGVGKAAPDASYPTLYIWGTVGSTHGMLRSTDKGLTWVRVNDDAHQYGGIKAGMFVTGDLHTYGRVYMSSPGRGIVYGSTAGETGDVIVTAAVPTQQPLNKCEYVITNPWWGGHVAEIRITNNRASAINGWTVNWTYSENSTVDVFWNANVSGATPNYTASGTWNSYIAPGATASFGLVAGNYNAAAAPAVTGDACN
ncbi:cellulose binding domain-containing protein [Pseudoduganella namucuonensis]|uniref:cellulose binding domain-containing protein n=1 Tax=Pseudoduganella namucuonensis TaxID=1035707 RepID=UPI0015A52825|nr:cellulose binding domain-containing protein [Pseudoduganella namucuonensis]